MNNAKSNSISSRTLTAAMLVLGMSFGTAAALAPATADAASAAKKETRYKVATKASKAVVGKKTTITVTLTADQPWHMNTDFPTGLKLKSSSGLKLAKAKLKKGDAKTLSEQKIEFVFDVTNLKAGKQNVTGDLKFAICKKESCSPAKAKINVPVDVKKK